MGKTPRNLGERLKEAWENPELDKTKAALEKLKSETSSGNTTEVLAQFENDMNELNVSSSEREMLRKDFENRLRIFRSSEAKQVNAFVEQFTKDTNLDELIEHVKKEKSKDSLHGIIQFARKGGPVLAMVGGLLSEALASATEKEDEDNPAKLAGTAKKAKKKAKEVKDKAKDAAKKAKKKAEKKKDEEKEEDAKKKSGSNSGAPAAAPSGSTSKSVGSKSYEMDSSGNYEKLSPEAFREKYKAIKNPKERHKFVLSQIAAGNANNTFEKVEAKGKTGMTVEFQVDRTGLRVASMDVQLDGPTAMAAALLTGCTLPNKWVVDKTYEAAKAKNGKVDFVDFEQIRSRLGIPKSEAYIKHTNEDGEEEVSPNGHMMQSAQFALTRARILKEQRDKKGISEDAFVAGQFKSILLPNAGKNGIKIYGARPKDEDRAIQPEAHPHGKEYSDYSHQLRRVKDTVTVTDTDGNKKTMPTTEFYASAEYGKEFGFEARKHGSYMNPALDQFVKDNKPGEQKTAPTAVAAKKEDESKEKAA